MGAICTAALPVHSVQLPYGYVSVRLPSRCNLYGCPPCAGSAALMPGMRTQSARLLLPIMFFSVCPVVQLAPELPALLKRPCVDLLLIDTHELPVLIQHSSVYDRGAAAAAHHAEQHVSVHIFF